MKDQGKPPKSANAIRAQLKSIKQTANVVRQKGPVDEETQTGRQVTVASFFDHKLGRRFQKELSSSGLFSDSAVRGRKLEITVDYSDVKVASQASEKFRAQFPDRQHVKHSARYDCLIFGSLIGLVVGMVFGFGTKDEIGAIAFAITVTGIFAAIGHLLDRAKMSAIQNHKLGLWEFLVFVALIGMFVIATQGFAILFD